MPQSLSCITLHTVFATKYRKPMIKPQIERELYAYMGKIIVGMGGIPFIINGMPDHIHILSTLPRTVSIAKYVENIKRKSSKWIKTKGYEYRTFRWQGGYATFSVSPSVEKIVYRYIANQKPHHLKQGYDKELIKTLEDHNVDYDLRYLWD
ncbi:MAG: transposase [Marinilabiliales bacterium]|nr:MAG: transposase [Marinilabiliales bacterium]